MIYETIFDIDINVPDYLEYCWLRYETNSYTDYENINKTREDGWEPVSIDSQPWLVDQHFIFEKYEDNFEFIIKNIKVINGRISSHGLVLCEREKTQHIPLSNYEAIEYLANKGIRIDNPVEVEKILSDKVDVYVLFREHRRHCQLKSNECAMKCTLDRILIDSNNFNHIAYEITDEDRAMFNLDKVEECIKASLLEQDCH